MSIERKSTDGAAFLLKFLKRAEYNVHQAYEHVIKCLRWRHAHRVDLLLDDFLVSTDNEDQEGQNGADVHAWLKHMYSGLFYFQGVSSYQSVYFDSSCTMVRL